MAPKGNGSAKAKKDKSMWLCKCGFENFGSRSECHKCKLHKGNCYVRDVSKAAPSVRTPEAEKGKIAQERKAKEKAQAEAKSLQAKLDEANRKLGNPAAPSSTASPPAEDGSAESEKGEGRYR